MYQVGIGMLNKHLRDLKILLGLVVFLPKTKWLVWFIVNLK